MKTNEIRGIIPAMVTAFNEDESINEVRHRPLDARCRGARHPGGTNGEFYAMTAAERQQVLEIVIDEVSAVLVYAGR